MLNICAMLCALICQTKYVFVALKVGEKIIFQKLSCLYFGVRGYLVCALAELKT